MTDDWQLTLAIKPTDTCWLQCSKEIAYQTAINGLLVDLREKSVSVFKCVQMFPRILPRPITSWYNFHDSKYWDEDT